MSSAIRSLSQIPARSNLLIAIADASDVAVAFTGDWMGSVTQTLNAVAYDIAKGDLFRDLGRQMMLVDAAGVHQGLFREAMPQKNAIAEGVGSNQSVWLCVWDAEGVSAKVARLG